MKLPISKNKRRLSLAIPAVIMLVAVAAAAIVASYQVTSTVTIQATNNLFLVKLSNGMGYTSENYGSLPAPSATDGAGFCFRNLGNTVLYFGGSQAFTIASGA